ncbi:hypothetical protein GCM10020254_36420 [Streptomyces goshikiensis]
MTLPIERFGRNHGEDINVVDDMKIKRLIAEQIGPKASEGPGGPSTPPASGEASSAAPAGAPASSPSPGASGKGAADGGGIPCVD